MKIFRLDWKSFKFSSLFLFVFFVSSLLAQDNNLHYYENRIRVKFKKASYNRVKQNRAVKYNNVALQKNVGLSSVDKLNNENKLKKINQLYKPVKEKYKKRHEEFGIDRWYELSFDSDIPVIEIIEKYSKDRHIEFAEQVYKKTLYNNSNNNLNSVVDDPEFAAQWHYENTGQTGGTPNADIDLQQAWDIETGDTNIIVAIIDGGIDYNHEDLRESMWINYVEASGTTGVDDDGNGYVDDIYGYNFVNNGGTIIAHPHGTHVGGTVAAVNNNGIGVSGVAGGDGTVKGARLMSCQVFTDFGGGGFAEAYVYAADNGAVIAQNSWGYTMPDVYEQAVLDAIDYFIANAGKDELGNQTGPMNGGIVIFSAGNNNSNAQYYPGCYPPVLSVASTNHNDQKSYYSNYGEWVDISAPGGETMVTPQGILSTLPSNTYGFYQGTSMACPNVSGVAALLVSEFKGPGLEPQNVRDRLVNSTDDIESLNPSYIGQLGSGRLNAFKALQTNDSIAPEKISDLSIIEANMSDIVLQWTAPGASSDSGTASSYDIRYSESQIDSANFNDAVQLTNLPSPELAGSVQTCNVDGLSAVTTYYFAIKASDVFGYKSEISNVVSVITRNVPVISVSPGSLYEALLSGESSTQILTIKNSSVDSDLEFEISTIKAGTLNKLNHEQNNVEIELQKGEKDPRAGLSDLFGSGTDLSGYSWIDSDEPGGPVFEWFDISLIGTYSGLTGDDNYVTLSLPFDFEFYGNNYTEIKVSTNGYLTFGSDGTDFINNPVPTVSYPNELIAVYWDDLYASGSNYHYYDIVNRRFIIQYENWTRLGSSDVLDFQVQLYENGIIEYYYSDMNGISSYGATIGTEDNLGLDGLNIAFNNGYLHDNMAIRILPSGDKFITIEPSFGSIPSGNVQDVVVNFNAEELSGGLYEFSILINSNDPANPQVTIPVSLLVKDSCMADTTFLSEEICQGDTVIIGDSIFTESGIYNVPMVDIFGCDFVVNLTLRGSQIVNLGDDQTILTTDTLILDAGDGFVSYYWNTNETTQNIFIDSSYGVGDHRFYIIAVDGNYCGSSDAITITIERPSNIITTDELSGSVKLYPNPTDGLLNMELNGIGNDVRLYILSTTGQVILSRNYESFYRRITDHFDLSEYLSGAYFIRVVSDRGEKLEKFILNR